MSTPTYMRQMFDGGLDTDIDAAAIDLQMGQDLTVHIVSTAENILFERGLAITRPGLAGTTPATLIPTTQRLLDVRTLFIPPYNANSNTRQAAVLAFTYDGTAFHIWRISPGNLSPLFTAVEITGPGITGIGANSIDVAVVNQVVVIAGVGPSMIRWDPTTTTYTFLAPGTTAAVFNFVDGHYARAIAAYGGPVAGNLQPATVGYSAQGDETIWQGGPVASLDAQATTISDIPDAISGIRVVKSLVLLARTYGFHIGWATGTFPIIYNWRKHSDKSIGCMYPGTYRIYKDVAFFMSNSGIHTFDLVNIQDIGEGVYQEIMDQVHLGNLVPRAFVASSYDNDLRPSYNIYLCQQVMSPASSTPNATGPHYMYDIREQKWSRHTYGAGLYAAAGFIDQQISASVVKPTIYMVAQGSGSNPAFNIWLAGSLLDVNAFITTGQVNVSGNPAMDKELTRIQVTYFSPAQAIFNITITVSFILDGTPRSDVYPITTYPGGGWDKRWVNIRQVGDFFQVTVTVPGAITPPVKFKSLLLEFTEVAKTRT